MSADVLLYNALNEDNKAKRAELAEIEACLATQNSVCSAAQDVITGVAQTTVGLNTSGIATSLSIWSTGAWGLIASTPGPGLAWSGGFKVCNTDAGFGCGCDCSWTVPAGVTCVRFQLWGAGAGSGMPCCCGQSSIGGIGAYASLIMPTAAGETFCLCSGCAYCCYACRNGTNTVDGCPSFVLSGGSNTVGVLTNFCAEGGLGGMYCDMRNRCLRGPARCNFCSYHQNAYICDSGSDSCHYPYNYTTSGSFAEDGWYPMMHTAKTYYGDVPEGHQIYGMNGSQGWYKHFCTSSFCITHPPVMGFIDGGNCQCCGCCIAQWNDRNGCYRSAQNGYMQMPGVGGWGAYQCAGANGNCADRGRMGMVCVQYFCT